MSLSKMNILKKITGRKDCKSAQLENTVIEDKKTVDDNDYTETALQKECGFFRISGKKYCIKDSEYSIANSDFYTPERKCRQPLLVPFGATEESVILTELKGDKYFCYRRAKDVHVFYNKELYPCFDSSDYEYEKRYYRSYYTCSSQKEVQEKFDYLTSCGVHTCNLNPSEEHRGYFAPYVHFDDDSPLNTFEVYEKKQAY